MTAASDDDKKEKKLVSKFPESSYKDNRCNCGRLTFSHVVDVHLDGTDDELNQRMEDIHKDGGRQHREDNK